MKVQLPILIQSRDNEKERERAESLAMAHEVVYNRQFLMCHMEDMGPFNGNVLNGDPVTYVLIAGIWFVVDIPYEVFRGLVMGESNEVNYKDFSDITLGEE